MPPDDPSPRVTRPLAIVADDEVHIVDLIALALVDLGYQVVPVYDGEHALQAVRDSSPELLVTDLMMPKLRGDILCRLIRANPALAATRIIVLTSFQTARLDDCPADVVLTKPFDLERLTHEVTRLRRDPNG